MKKHEYAPLPKFARKWGQKRREDVARLFEEARQDIWRGPGQGGGNEHFICIALSRLHCARWPALPWHEIENARKLISRLLRHETVEDYLHSILPEALERDDVQQFRIRWLTALANSLRKHKK